MRWNIDPTLVSWGPIELRYYGLLFALGLFLAAFHGPRYFRAFGLPGEHAERLTLWVPVGMLLGAHYIHLVFYEPSGLSDFRLGFQDGHPVIGRFWNLGSGLASHGGGLGCYLALLAFWWREGKPRGLHFHRYADALMVSSVWVYPFVRLGNFMNSEIVGRPTDVPWGVIFERHYATPRHPVQLYEAAMYFVEIAIAAWLVRTRAGKLREGAVFYAMLGIHFSMRFVAEFFKESQGIDEGWALNMGHWLSLPIVAVCAFMVIGTKRFSILRPLDEDEVRANEAVLAAARSREAERSGASASVEAASSSDAPSDAPSDASSAPSTTSERASGRSKSSKKKNK